MSFSDENISKHSKAMTVAYRIQDALYLNITNRCPNHCVFCIRKTHKGVGYNLWLAHEPSVDEIIQAIDNPSLYKEVVFCGYGEPLLRADVVVEVARWLKKMGAKKVRINTNGLADLFLDYDVVPRLAGLIDEISISLNAHDAKGYFKLTQSPYGEGAYDALLQFAKRCSGVIPKVIFSVVDYPGVDMKKAEMRAVKLGAEFRVRKYQQD